MEKQNKNNLPKLNIDKLLSLPKCPKCASILENRDQSIKYAIYQYVNKGAKITKIADEIRCKSYINIIYWLKRYGVYEKDTYDRKKLTGKIPFKRTNKFCKKAKKLFDSGIKTYASIARKMKCNETVIASVAKENGWASELNRRKFKWIIPKKFMKNDIVVYKTYKLTIYHFSKKMVEKYFSEKEKQKLKTKKFEVDHIVSIYEAFNRGINPLPWQIVCHPANLQVLTREANLIKGRNSDLSPIELINDIKLFEKENGKVPLPIHSVPIPKYLAKFA
jgi:hypothetical protein